MSFSFLATIICIEILAWGEIDLLVPSFPTIQDEFVINAFKTELLLSVNLFANCITSLLIGVIAENYDKRKAIIFSLGIFFIGSILGYFSENYNLLLFARILQGIGIAGPMLLGNVLISNYYPLNLQQQLIGIVNGFSTIILIFAPLLGSSINILFGWRVNFIIFMIMTVINIILSYFYIPSPKDNRIKINENRHVRYLNIIKSKKTLLYIFIINLTILPYWTFLGLGPILFIKSLNISLKEYSLYQTSLAISFAIISFICAILIKRIGIHKTFYFAVVSLVIFIFFVIYIIIFDLYNPILIILSIHVLTIGTAFVYNILTPLSFKSLPYAESHIAAFSTFIKFILVAISVQLVSKFYHNNFIALGISMIIYVFIAGLIYYFMYKKYDPLIIYS